MLNISIHVLEVLVLVLVGYIAARSFTLAKKQSAQPNTITPESALDNEQITVEEPATHDYNTRVEALKEAKIFAGIQMIPIKREFSDLDNPQLKWLRDAIALYLIGASDCIAKDAGCDQRTRNKFNTLVLSTTLNMSEAELATAMSNATTRDQGSEEDEMIIAGAQAAKQWKDSSRVNESLKLRTRLNDWGVFA